MKKQTNTQGFSLVELLVVATIIIVLTTIGLVSFQSAGRNSRDAKRKADLETVRQALVLRRADLGNYPSGSDSPVGSGFTSVTGTLITGQYLTAPAPVDPKNVSPNIYRYTSGGTSFCLCASMENAANAGGATSGCPAGITYRYCVANP